MNSEEATKGEFQLVNCVFHDGSETEKAFPNWCSLKRLYRIRLGGYALLWVVKFTYFPTADIPAL